MDTTTPNPYAAPRATVADVPSDGRVQAVRVWNPGGRMGRLHYIGYSIGFSFLLGAAAFLVGLVTGALASSTLSMVLLGAVYVGYFVLLFELTVQRCHDMNWSGWLSLIALIPLVNLLFWFVPGTTGANRWGAPPVRGPRWAMWVAGLFVGLMLLGIVAAIALPAYQQYVMRAKAAQTR
jgi:uncharacterized membrane protein YhaH (DUF805 family)